MKRDSKLSGVLHVLLHIAENDGPTTSDALAQAMGTNPVVVRRLMSGLRAAGFVDSEKGHGGGWLLACPLEHITLADIHAALGGPGFFAMGNRDENPACLVEQSVNAALDTAFLEAEALLRSRLEAITLAQLSTDFHRRMVGAGHSRKAHTHEI